MSSSRQTIVALGVGQMGGVFATGFLRLGHPVHPVLRDDDQAQIASRLASPALVAVMVGEADLDPVLAAMPAGWRDRLLLIQNELLPRTWLAHGIERPTVSAVWFEKKAGRAAKAIASSPVAGPHAGLVAAAIGATALPAHEVGDAQIEYELVLKNLYILVANIAGLDAGGTVGELWAEHRDLAEAVAADVLAIQEGLIGGTIDRGRLLDALPELFAADPDHGTRGRSAPARLARALDHARQLDIEAPALRAIAARHADPVAGE